MLARLAATVVRLEQRDSLLANQDWRAARYHMIGNRFQAWWKCSHGDELLDVSRPIESLINRIFNVLELWGASNILNGHKFDSWYNTTGSNNSCSLFALEIERETIDALLVFARKVFNIPKFSPWLLNGFQLDCSKVEYRYFPFAIVNAYAI